jgi:hypothetical protein
MSDYTPITATIGVLAFVLSLYNLWYSHREPVRKNQSATRLKLKETLHSLDFYRLDGVLGTLNNAVPSQRIKDELQSIKQYILMSKDEFIAPTPAQLAAFVGMIDQTLNDWDAATGTPQTDAVFRADGDKESREVLKRDFEQLRQRIRCIVNGINRIEKSALSERQQKWQFKAPLK